MIGPLLLGLAMDATRAPIIFEQQVVSAERAWADCMDNEAKKHSERDIDSDRVLKLTASACTHRGTEYRARLEDEFGRRSAEILAIEPDFNVAGHVERFETNWLGLIGMRLDAAAGRELGEYAED